MKRHAVFVDAGYVFAQGAVSLGTNSGGGRLRLDEEEIVRLLREFASIRNPSAQLLRIYWYDGARSGPTIDHLKIANLADVKLRLGSINSSGQQKEVDALLVTDLIELARNQAICDATVVTGDSDVRVAVQIAQSFGVRVHLIGLAPSGVSQSALLRHEVDTIHEISRADVARFLKISNPSLPVAIPEATPFSQEHPPASPPAIDVKTSAPDEKRVNRVFETAIAKVLSAVSAEHVGDLREALTRSQGIPREYDGRLLGTCRALLERDLTEDEKRQLRSTFVRSMLGTAGAENS